MTKALYNAADVTEVRKQLIEEQEGKDKLTTEVIPDKQAVLDHNHKTMYVRSVLHRQTNAALGKIENVWTRYLSYWYPGDLPMFLEQCAVYLREPDDKRWHHPQWIKKINTLFNSLKEAEKDKVLKSMMVDSAKNSIERKKSFQKAILTRGYSYDTLRNIIGEIRNESTSNKMQ